MKTIFDETFDGFESLFDLERSISEAVDPQYNPKMEGIPAEFQGKMRVVITYEEPAKVDAKCDCRCHNIPREGFFHCFSPCKCSK